MVLAGAGVGWGVIYVTLWLEQLMSMQDHGNMLF